MLADQPHIKVNDDLFVSDRKARSILLRKLYELISSGVDRHSIRLRHNSLLVGGRKYGSIVNQSFELCPLQGHTSPANSPGDTLSMALTVLGYPLLLVMILLYLAHPLQMIYPLIPSLIPLLLPLLLFTPLALPHNDYLCHVVCGMLGAYRIN